VFGDDLDTLRRLADDIERVLLDIRGAADVSREQITGSRCSR